MKTSENINEIATALSKAQGEMMPAVKDSQNPFFKSKYSDLSSVNSVIKEPLQRNGLSVLQDVTTMEKSVAVKTMIIHSSGQWIEFSPMTLPISKSDIQGFGSAITYARRYALCSSLCIVSEEDRALDDDGNSHVVHETKAKAKVTPIKKESIQFIEIEQIKELSGLLNSSDPLYVKNFLDHIEKLFSKRDICFIPSEAYANILAAVKNHVASQAVPVAL